MKKLLFVFVCAALLGACASAPKTVEELKTGYTGTFYGELPCADCEGIMTEVTLNPDGTYALYETYYKNDNFTPYKTQGKWIPSKDLKYVELKDAQDPRTVNYYAFNGKNELKKLDMEAKPIDSRLNYTLKRKTVDFNSVKNKVWKLAAVTDINGAAVFDAAKLDKETFKDIYTLQFDGEGRASGRAWPNRYTASYSQAAGDNLTIGPAAATKMAAFKEPAGLNEDGFLGFLHKVYGWDIENGRLVLKTIDGHGGHLDMTFDEADYR